MNFNETYHLHPAMRLLRKAIRQEQQAKMTVSFLFIAGGGAFGYLFFEQKNILATFGLASILFGLHLLWEVMRRPKPEDEHLWKLLNKRSRQIVWVFYVNTQTMPFGLYLWEESMMYFKLADGSEISIALPSKKLRMVSRFLNRLLPHAAFGFSYERQRQFEVDPANLLRIKKGKN